jgi:hypothetical protein
LILLNPNQKTALNKTNSSIINQTNELNNQNQTTSMNNSKLNNDHENKNDEQPSSILNDQQQQAKNENEQNFPKISHLNQNLFSNNQFDTNFRQNNFMMYNNNNPMMNNYNNYINNIQVICFIHFCFKISENRT